MPAMSSHTIRWTGDLTLPEQQSIRDIVSRSAVVDGVAALGGHVLDGLGDGLGVYGLLEVPNEEDLKLVGVASVRSPDPGELLVDTAFRGQGLGTQLLRETLERVGGVWAHGDLPAARVLTRGAGLEKTRELLQLRRPLTNWQDTGSAEAVVLPDGVHIRTFVPGQDEKQFLEVNARAFSWHPEQGRLDANGLHAEMAQPWFDPRGFFVAETEDDRMLGFHWTKIHPETAYQPPIGEVYVIGVDPLSPIRGLGRPLTIIGLDYLKARELGAVMLYAEGDNIRALRLYRDLGFEVYSSDVVYSTPS